VSGSNSRAMAGNDQTARWGEAPAEPMRVRIRNAGDKPSGNLMKIRRLVESSSGKAAEDSRTPKPVGTRKGIRFRGSVMECGCPLPLLNNGRCHARQDKAQDPQTAEGIQRIRSSRGDEAHTRVQIQTYDPRHLGCYDPFLEHCRHSCRISRSHWSNSSPILTRMR
jgi:hypothetical protein